MMPWAWPAMLSEIHGWFQAAEPVKWRCHEG